MKKNRFDDWIQGRDPVEVQQILDPYLTEARKARIEEVLAARHMGVHIAFEQVSDIHNALAVLRSGESFGVTRAHFIAPQGSAKGGWNTTRGALNWVDLRFYDGLTPFMAGRRRQGYRVAGASLEGSMELGELPVGEPVCLLFGNEQRGLTPEAHQVCDYLFRIPMLGMTQSLNLSVASGITLYDYLQRRRQHLQEMGDLEGDGLSLERTWYYIQSVSPRLFQGLFSD